MKRIALFLIILPCLSCHDFTCWPFCQDVAEATLQESQTTGATAKHCQAVGDSAPDGGHLHVYKECMRDAGLEP